MEKNTICDICYGNSPSIILNCGCLLCSDCFEASTRFIEGDIENFYSC